jgi:hypothetical protein
MSEKVLKLGIKKEPGYLYFLDKSGNVGKVIMVRGKAVGKHKKEIVAKTKIEKEPGYLYFLDKQGDIAKIKMMRGRKPLKKTIRNKKN